MKTSKLKLKANRVPDFDMLGDKHYGDYPYGVCLDVYDNEGHFLENGTDWTYFATEKEAEQFCLKFNNLNKENNERKQKDYPKTF
jgi:hypothetical protein